MTADRNRDMPGSGLRHRSLTPRQCQAIAAALSNGVTADLLAGEYGVSKRTIYRAGVYGREQWRLVRVGDWAAEFVLTEDGPVRCTAWYPA